MKQFLDKKLKGAEMKEVSGGRSITTSCVRCGVVQRPGARRGGTTCRNTYFPTGNVCRSNVSQGWVMYQVWEKKIGVNVYTRFRARTASCIPGTGALHGWTPCGGGRWYRW